MNFWWNCLLYMRLDDNNSIMTSDGISTLETTDRFDEIKEMICKGNKHLTIRMNCVKKEFIRR